MLPLMQVAGELAILLDTLGGRPQRSEVAAGLRFGGTVGHEQPMLGDRTDPTFLLLVGSAEHDGIRAEEGRESAGGNPEIDAGEQLGHSVDVECIAAHAAVFLGDEQKRHAENITAETAHDLLGECILGVDLDQRCIVEFVLRIVLDRCHDEVERVAIQSHGGSLL